MSFQLPTMPTPAVTCHELCSETTRFVQVGDTKISVRQRWAGLTVRFGARRVALTWRADPKASFLRLTRSVTA
jgi:hypothetical protein